MPYNNTAIPPPEEITGSTSLPLARVKRILNADEDIGNVSGGASFVITVATEMFTRYLAEQATIVVKSERKPRRNIQYKDLANAVARIDNLEFLSDVIPRTSTYREFKEKRVRATKPKVPLQTGQTTLDTIHPRANRPIQSIEGPNGSVEERTVSPDETVDDDEEVMGDQGDQSEPPPADRLRFEHYQPNGNLTNGNHQSDSSGDIEMA